MFEKTIIFKAPKAYIDNTDDRPKPIVLNIPEWFKSLKHTIDKGTVKGCMPFLDTLTYGYSLSLPQDVTLEHNVKREDNSEPVSGIGFPLIADSGKLGINLNHTANKDWHPTDQLKGSPLVEKNKNLPFHKFMNPWTIITPPGYSCLFVSPLNNSDDRFTILPGIVDTDKYPQEVNFPFVVNGDKYPSLKTVIKKGTPYVQIIPFQRDAWKMKIEKISGRESYFQKLFYRLRHISTYKEKFWSKKKCK